MKKSFTMAELLIAVVVIGVLAAIILPALQDKITKKQWNLHKKALNSRMTQAVALLPKISGYGEYTVGEDENGSSVVTDTAAMTFVTEGLSKVYKINNICDNTNFKKCGLPDRIVYQFEPAFTQTFPKTLKELLYNMGYNYGVDDGITTNTKAVAVETANGESIAVYYKPDCVDSDAASLPAICAHFIIDLNGLNGPNRIGYDIAQAHQN